MSGKNPCTTLYEEPGVNTYVCVGSDRTLSDGHEPQVLLACCFQETSHALGITKMPYKMPKMASALGEQLSEKYGEREGKRSGGGRKCEVVDGLLSRPIGMSKQSSNGRRVTSRQARGREGGQTRR